MNSPALPASVAFPRTDRSILGQWWWTVDRWLLAAIALLIGVGLILTFAASPPVAERLHAPPYFFVKRQLTYLPLAICVMLGVSLQSVRNIRRLSILVFGCMLVLLFSTLLLGPEIKGATRWITLGGLTVQPSEFIKPGFAVVTAWLLSCMHRDERFPGYLVCTALFAVIVGTLLCQPDVGMSLVISAVWATQLFLAGLSLVWVGLFILTGTAGLIAAYFIFPHVQLRVDSFLSPENGGTYQVRKAMEAFHDGGLFGRGPGEGVVKASLPDAHTDFILAVAGEEFGLVLCLLIVGLFSFILLRGFFLLLRERNLFVLLACAGVLVQFGLQALINMASTLNMMPTKGMTLPFISYGGSSLVALALGMGIVLGMTRKRAGIGGGHDT